FRMTELRIHLLQLAIDHIQSFNWCQLIAKPCQAKMRARGNERVDLRCREVVQQSGDEVIQPVKRERLARQQSLEIGKAVDVDGDLDPFVERTEPPGHRAA